MQTDEVFHLPRTTVFVFPFNFFSDDPLGPLTPSPWALWQLKEPQLHMVPHYYMRWLSVNPKNRLEPGGRKLKRSKSFWFHECGGWPSAHTHTHAHAAGSMTGWDECCCRRSHFAWQGNRLWCRQRCCCCHWRCQGKCQMALSCCCCCCVAHKVRKGKGLRIKLSILLRTIWQSPTLSCYLYPFACSAVPLWFDI